MDFIKKISKRDENRDIISENVSQQNFVHCPVCGAESVPTQKLGRQQSYMCKHCEYKFSNVAL